MAQSILNLRRYYLLKRQLATELEQTAIAAVWQAKQQAESGSDLPASFPYLGRLADAFYTTRDDLDGATVEELSDQGCFSVLEANEILTAFSNLED
jgi:hypothetical protein